MNFLTIFDLDKDGIYSLIDRASELKERHKSGIPYHPLRCKTLGLIFEKASTRTRVSFETAMYQLGGNAIFISQRDSQIGRGEPIKDTARVMSRYVDAVLIRTFGHEVIEEFAEFSTVPVINGLTDEHHPCQVMADLLTVKERKGAIEGLKIAWIGDGNNMANSWMESASRLGFELRLACPDGYKPTDEMLKRVGADTKGSTIHLVSSVAEAVSGADVLNTDVWASMGQEDEGVERSESFKGYQINDALLKKAADDAMVLHCLPAHRGEEITEEVMEGPNSAIFEQAENRLHIQKAILERLLAGDDI